MHPRPFTSLPKRSCSTLPKGEPAQSLRSQTPATPVRRGFRWCGALLVAVVCAAFARAEAAKEYQVKAAFLYNFTKFIEWSAERFPDENAPIRIAVIGKNPFDDELEKIIRDRRVNGHGIAVVFLSERNEMKSPAESYHVVFVPAGEEKTFEQMAPAFEAAGTLTVGESQRFANCGIVNFTTVDNKVRFEINTDIAQRVGLKISAQLLKLATIVHKKS